MVSHVKFLPVRVAHTHLASQISQKDHAVMAAAFNHLFPHYFLMGLSELTKEFVNHCSSSVIPTRAAKDQKTALSKIIWGK